MIPSDPANGKYSDTYWVQRLDALSSAGSVVHMGDAAVTGNKWNFVAVEIHGIV